MASGARRIRALAATAAGVVVAVGAAVALGATGDLDYRSCITGETQSGPAGSGACDAIGSAASSALNSGLGGPNQVALSSDGTSLYVVSLEDDAIARFARDTTNGKLDYKGCITGETQSGPAGTGACAQIPSATSNGTSSGMDFPVALEVSPDGGWVYVISQSDDAVARFKRDTTSGKLSYKDCITGELQSGPSGTGACDAIPGAATDGQNAGLNDPHASVLSNDGQALYLAGLGDEAVIRFSRDFLSGKLKYKGCLTGDTAAAAACETIPSATAGGAESGLSNPIDVAVSNDGTSLYLGAQGDTAVARFGRDASSGKLDYKDCLTGDTDTGPAGSGACDATPTAAADGRDSGLESLRALVVSPDLRNLYATGPGDDAVTRFARKTTNGGLDWSECITGDRDLTGVCHRIPTHTPGGTRSGFDGAGEMAISSDGASLYVAAGPDDAVTAFARESTKGKLTHLGCITGDEDTGPTPAGSGACKAIPSVTANGIDSGLDNVQDLALSPDDASLYTASNGDDSIARFSRDP